MLPGGRAASQPAAVAGPAPSIFGDPSAPKADTAATLAALSPAYRALFSKGTVTGEDLYTVLTEMRTELLRQRSVKAFAQIELSLQAVTSESALTGDLDLGSILSNMAVPAAISLMKSYASTTAMQQLDEHLNYLLEDRRSALAEESVTLTLPPGADAAQAKRIVNLATLVIAAKVTNKMLERADQDFKSLQTDYGSLLKQREAAAEVLLKTLDDRRTAMRGTDPAAREKIEAELRQSLSERDLAFLDATFNTMSFKDALKEMAAQNIGIQFLRSKNPDLYKSYRSKADDVVRRTRAYVRTMSGIIAFASMTMNFGQTAAEILNQKGLDGKLASMPMMADFLIAAMPLGKRSVEMAVTGVTLPLTTEGGFIDIFRSKRAFIVSKGGGQTFEASSVAEVFKHLQGEREVELFGSALFPDDVSGWLGSLYRCDRVETGRMIDTTLDKGLRTRFAAEHLQYSDDKASEFAFVNALSAKPVSARERDLPRDLLTTNQRRRALHAPVAEVQHAVVANAKQWSNDQFLRLIFHNLEGGAAYANLQLGDVSVRPVPSPASVYAYEARVETCRRENERAMAGANEPAAVAPATPVAAPATTTAPKSTTPAPKPAKKKG